MDDGADSLPYDAFGQTFAERSLPDGHIDEVGLDGWQSVLDLIASRGWTAVIVREAESATLPTAADELFADDSFGTLKVWPASTIQVNLFPHRPADLDFDFDTAEIADQSALNILCRFIEELSAAVDRPVTIAHEGDATPVIRFDPHHAWTWGRQLLQ